MTYIPKYQIAFTLKRMNDLAKRKSHAEHETELELSTLLTIVAGIPKWKVWLWLPLVTKIASAVHKHRDCCPGIEKI